MLFTSTSGSCAAVGCRPAAATQAQRLCTAHQKCRHRSGSKTQLAPPKAVLDGFAPHVQVEHDVAEALSSVGVNPLSLILPVTAVLAGAAALKFYFYSQLEYITASMLTKYVPKGGNGATVIQLGGGTRELYYYPKNTMTVINVGDKVNKGLMEQAGVTAAVPTIAKQQPVTDLSFQADRSVDAVIVLGVLSELNQQQRQQCLQEIIRVLRPGMPMIFVEPIKEGGSPLRGLVGVSAGKQALSEAQLQSLQSPAFSFVQYDVALSGQDPHAVGVAVRSEVLQARLGDDDIDIESSKQRRKGSKNREKTAKGFQ